MDSDAMDLAAKIINPSYVSNARQALSRVESAIKSLLAQRRLPEEGWSDEMIEYFLNQLSLMDSNNYTGNVGVGEREGRVFSRLVRERHRGLAHGIGRSGDLLANQPKAAGSSLIYALTNLLAADALRLCGASRVAQALVVPMATGMALSLVLQSLPTKLASSDPSAPLTKKRYVIWSRIDQKTCFKCIYTAGFEAKVVPLRKDGDFFVTDLTGIEEAILSCGVENTVCVLTTTSCFAPRLPDRILDVSRLCKKHNVPHVVNNAYGMQSSRIMKEINAAMEHGRVDAFVQSTDKNFMVPVGGSVVASSDSAFIQRVAATYAGRASGSAVLDLFITLLSMGRKGYQGLLKEREATLKDFHSSVREYAESVGERLLAHPANDISFCMTLSQFQKTGAQLGSSLFYHSVSGPRVVTVGERKTVCGYEFFNSGAHSDECDVSYITMACAIGITREDIMVFLKRLKKSWGQLAKKQLKMQRGAEREAEGNEPAPQEEQCT